MKNQFWFVIIAACTWPAWADNCIVEQRTVSRQSMRIEERSALRRDILPAAGGHRTCRVDLRVRIGRDWHVANGEYTWPGDAGVDQACAVALDRAEQSARDRVARAQVISENVVICSDRTDTVQLSGVGTGTVGKAAQFRPHPDYPARFYHNGAQCRMFVEPAFVAKDIKTFQGVVCEIGSDQWVVVDKF